MEKFSLWLEAFSDADFNRKGEWIDKKIGPAKLQVFIGDGMLELASVRVAKTNRGQGGARLAMQELIKEADKRGLKIKLLASPLDQRTNPARLVNFYKSLGFEVTGRGNPAGDPIMVRQPALPEPKPAQNDLFSGKPLVQRTLF